MAYQNIQNKSILIVDDIIFNITRTAGLLKEFTETPYTEDTSTKSKWVIRMEFDSETLLEKNITMDDIHFAINSSYNNDITCVYTDYNSSNLIFRIRRSSIWAK